MLSGISGSYSQKCDCSSSNDIDIWVAEPVTASSAWLFSLLLFSNALFIMKKRKKSSVTRDSDVKYFVLSLF